MCLALIVISATLLIWTTDSLVRLLATGFLTLFLPGYLLVALLLNTENTIWKLSLLLPASFALVGGILLLVNYSGTYDYPLVIWLIAGTDVCLLIAIRLRRVNLGVFLGSVWIGKLKLVFEESNLWKKLFYLSVAIFVGSIVYAAIVPKQTYFFTQFYVLTADKKIPFAIDRQELENSGLTVGVSNHEGRDGLYTVFVKIGEQTIGISPIIALKAGEVWEQPVSFVLPEAGDDQAVDLVLERDGSASPYRTLRLWLNVTPAP